MRDYLEFFKKCFDVKGKTTRKKYWKILLTILGINILCLYILNFRISYEFDRNAYLYMYRFAKIFNVIILIPLISMSIRRLNDAEISPRKLLIPLASVVFCIILGLLTIIGIDFDELDVLIIIVLEFCIFVCSVIYSIYCLSRPSSHKNSTSTNDTSQNNIDSEVFDDNMVKNKKSVFVWGSIISFILSIIVYKMGCMTEDLSEALGTVIIAVALFGLSVFLLVIAIYKVIDESVYKKVKNKYKINGEGKSYANNSEENSYQSNNKEEKNENLNANQLKSRYMVFISIGIAIATAILIKMQIIGKILATIAFTFSIIMFLPNIPEFINICQSIKKYLKDNDYIQ